MKLQLRGYNLKVFSKGVRLFAKLSDQVLIIADNNRLKLQAINEIKTVFLEMQFEKQFFVSYECETETKCKLFMKSLILVFRVLNIDKVVNTCTMIMDDSMPKVIFEMNCRNDMKRESFLPYMESNHLRYTSSLSQTIPSFKVKAKVMSECLQNFSTQTKDISLWLNSQRILFKNYFDDDEEQNVTTSFAYNSNEFNDYKITNEISVTFNLKDLKDFIDFCTFGDQTLSCYFETSGRPIEFTLNTSSNYSSRIMLATHDFPVDHIPVPPSVHNSNTQSTDLMSSGDVTSIETPNSIDNNQMDITSVPNTGLNMTPISTDYSNGDDMADPFDDDDDDLIEQALSQLPEFAESQTIWAEEVEHMNPQQLSRYHASILYGDESDESNYGSDEILAPDSDKES